MEVQDQGVKGLANSEASLLGLQLEALLLTLHVIIPLCMYAPGFSLCLQISSSYKDTSQIGLGPTLMASF